MNNKHPFLGWIPGVCLGLMSTLAVSAQTGKPHYQAFNNVRQTQAYFRYTGEGAPIISGHRGGALPGYPENCIPTFEHTLRATPAMFEIDPHLTRDSGIVLLHDDKLERTTNGHGRLNAHTLAEVRALRLKDLDGRLTPYHLPTLEEAIRWGKGKTLLNLDVKDVPLAMKAELVKKHHAFAYVMFTVHDASEARFFYDFDHRSLFSAWILTREAFDAYAASGVPWANFLIAYIGPKITEENKTLITLLHARGVKVMIGAGPSIDKLPDAGQRAEEYRRLIAEGIDIIESDRPIEVAEALRTHPTL